MKAAQVISLTLLSVLSAGAQLIKFGICPKPDVQANFDATRVNMKSLPPFLWGKKAVHACGKPAFSLQYIGKWYEIEKLPTTFQKGQCGTATYTAKSPGVIGVLNRELL